ncbi:MAG: hypothetical protein IBJ18_13450 [Phycisphaerales bacterium]|nr:hypothetical protein [Phycisphaerales bacterium]
MKSETQHHRQPGGVRAAAVVAGALGAGLIGGVEVKAQEAMYTAAATMPSPGVYVLRQQYHWFSYSSSPSEGTDRAQRLEVKSSLQYGLVKDLSLTLDVPVEYTSVKYANRQDTDDSVGVDDLDLTLKWRFYQNDPGGIDTIRIALLGGARLRTEGRFSTDPHVGIVYTQVHDIHGFNAEAHYTFNTGSDPGTPNFGGKGDSDALNLNLAYVLRVFPITFTPESKSAWYVTAELNHLYEANGDHELKFSPGLMYEGRRWGFEIMGQIPVYTRLNHRARQTFGIGIGWRYIF